MWQFAGAFLIVTSIVTAKLPDIVGKGTSGGINAVPLAAISLAIVASSNSGSGFGEQRIPSLSYCMYVYVRLALRCGNNPVAQEGRKVGGREQGDSFRLAGLPPFFPLSRLGGSRGLHRDPFM